MSIYNGSVGGMCVGAIDLAINFRPHPQHAWHDDDTWTLVRPFLWTFSGMVTQIGINTIMHFKDERSFHGALSVAYTVGEVFWIARKLYENEMPSKIMSVAARCFTNLTSCCRKRVRKHDDDYLKSLETVLQRDWECAKKGENTDITFKVDNNTFTAHKAILRNRCEYFHVMFKNNFRETNDGFIEIKDQRPRIVELALKFIYCQSLNDDIITNYEMDLLSDFADLWLLPGLKDFCNAQVQMRVRKLMRRNGLPDDIAISE